jgi:hypothetical protein
MRKNGDGRLGGMRCKWRTARVCCASSVSGMRLAAVHVDETWDDCRSLDFPSWREFLCSASRLKLSRLIDMRLDVSE